MMMYLQYLAFLWLAQFLRLLPLSLVRTTARFVAWVVFHLIPVRKKQTLDHLRHAYPEHDDRVIQRIARGSYVNLVTAIFELMWTPKLGLEQMKSQFHIHGTEVLRNAMRKGFGVVIVSGHMGNWEWMAVCVGHLLDLHLHVIVHPVHNSQVNALIDAWRRQFGNTTIPMASSVREVLTALRRGGVVALLADQSGPMEALYVDFFGRPASTYGGPAFFALRCGSPVIFVSNVRAPDGTYDVMFEEIAMKDLPDASEVSVYELTRRHVQQLEDQIRLHPDQWLWQHKRWKHSPALSNERSGV